MTTTDFPARTALRQIGTGNVLAISGGRFRFLDENTVELPVSNGYFVVVQYDPGPDTYTVRREFRRAGKVFPRGSKSGIYCDQLGEIAYEASCFRSDKYDNN